MSVRAKVSGLDFMGIFLSVLCAIHCTMTPLILLFLPSLKGLFDSEYFHVGLFVFILPTAVFSFLRCHKLHGQKNVLVLGGLALVCLFAGMLLEDYSHNLEVGLTILGSILIVTAHIKNIKYCSCFKKHSPCSH